jgi:hypothetical protein
MITVRLLVVPIAVAAVVGRPQAQEPPPRVTVTERDRPEVDAVEHKLGAFDLATMLGFGSEHDDNVFAERDAPRADTALWLEPAFELASNWTRHSLSLAGDFKAVRYSDYSTENYDDNGLRLAAQLDVRDSSPLSFDLSHTEGVEGRESPDDRGGDERTRVDTDVARIGYANERTRLKLEVDTEWTQLDFQDAYRSRDASVINNDDRDRREAHAQARVGYQISTDYGFFVQAVANDRSYDQRIDDDGFNRSSRGWELALGLALDRSGIVYGDFFAGYRRQQFEDARFEDVEGPTFGAALTWNVTALTTFTALAERILEDTTIVGVSGIESTRFRLAADHELRRNLILSLALDTEEEDFQGVDQTDDIRGARFTLRYLMNRRLHLLGGYRTERRSSSAADPFAFEYAKDVYFVQLQGHL